MAPIIKKGDFISGQGIRLSRRLAKKRRNKRLSIFLILLVLGLVVCFTIYDGKLPQGVRAFPGKVVGYFSNIDLIPSGSGKKADVISKRLNDDPARTIVLVMGINNDTGRELIDGAIVLSVNFSEKTVDGISIPKDTFVSNPPFGFQRLSEVMSLGDESKAVEAVQELLGVKISGYAKLRAIDYQTILTDEFEGLFDKDIGSDIKESDKIKVTSLISETKALDDIIIVPLPVESYGVGTEVYFEPKDDELEGLIERIWGIKIERVAKTSVKVYNGSGVPGVAADAANKLLNAGFEVLGSTNADSFDYKETEVWDYGEAGDAPQKVLKTLRIGKIVRKPATQDVADVLVVIGQDYKLSP